MTAWVEVDELVAGDRFRLPDGRVRTAVVVTRLDDGGVKVTYAGGGTDVFAPNAGVLERVPVRGPVGERQ